MDPKQQRKRIAEETVLILSDHSYFTPTKNRIDLYETMQFSLEGTILYGRGDYTGVLKESLMDKNHNTVFQFEAKNTLDCVKDMLVEHPEEDIVALNFASAKNPGGGFLKGSQAQEESIARASAIYTCLTQDRVAPFYKENHEDRTCLYTHNIIYSPKVSVFRDSNEELLENPYLCSFITSPAVNAGHALDRVGAERVRSTMIERIDRVLAVAVANGHRVIVLGAWGCGVFRNSVEDVAKYFRNYLAKPDSKYRTSFSHVYFAIPDQDKLIQFQQAFESNAPTKTIPIQSDTNMSNKKRAQQANNGRKNQRLQKEYRSNNN